MRIISGTHKSRKIIAPKKLPVRPTTDRAKEGLFNILHQRLEWESIKALDLFSGTGNMSYEMASRGVQAITAIDKDRHCVHFIRDTAQKFSFSIHVLQQDIFRMDWKFFTDFDLVFADPPYDISNAAYHSLISDIVANTVLTPAGYLIVEHRENNSFDDHVHFDFSRRYGSSVFSFFK